MEAKLTKSLQSSQDFNYFYRKSGRYVNEGFVNNVHLRYVESLKLKGLWKGARMKSRELTLDTFETEIITLLHHHTKN